MRKDSIQSRKRKPKNKKTEEGAEDKEKEKKAPGECDGEELREKLWKKLKQYWKLLDVLKFICFSFRKLMKSEIWNRMTFAERNFMSKILDERKMSTKTNSKPENITTLINDIKICK